MDPSGAKPFQPTPTIDRCFNRHRQDYAAQSATPDDFDACVAAVTEMMQTQPNVMAAELAAVQVPVTIAQSEHDEFIQPEHAQYLARNIPGARFVQLPGVSHCAPLQWPALFNEAVLGFLVDLAHRKV